VPLLITIFVVIWDIFIEIFEGSPTIEVVPEVIERFNLILTGTLISKCWDRMIFGESGLGFENPTPKFVKISLGKLLLAWRIDIGCFINRVILASSHRIE